MQGRFIIPWTERRAGNPIFERFEVKYSTSKMALSFAHSIGCKEVSDEINKALSQSMSSDAIGHQRRGSEGHGSFLIGMSVALLDEKLDVSNTGSMN